MRSYPYKSSPVVLLGTTEFHYEGCRNAFFVTKSELFQNEMYQPLFWNIVKRPLQGEVHDFPFRSILPGWPSSSSSPDPFAQMEKFLVQLPYMLDEDKVKRAFPAPGETSMEVVRSDDDKTFSCNFHLHGFEPDDIKIRTVGQKVIVNAQKESDHKDENFESFSRRQYHRSIMLRDNVNVDQLTSSLNSKGVLKLTAPLLALPAPEERSKEVPISVQKMETYEGE